MVDLRREERAASEIIRRVTGWSISQNDDGSQPSMFDLSASGGGVNHAIEVVTAVDSSAMEQWSAVHGDDSPWIFPGIDGGWIMRLSGTVRAKNTRRLLPPLLAVLEREGVQSLKTAPHDLRLKLEKAGVTYLRQSPTERRGSVYYMPNSLSAAWLEDLTSIAPWISGWLTESSNEDVLHKLAKSKMRRRHAFVIVPLLSTAPATVQGPLFDQPGSVPAESPSLPPSTSEISGSSTQRTSTRSFSYMGSSESSALLNPVEHDRA